MMGLQLLSALVVVGHKYPGPPSSPKDLRVCVQGLCSRVTIMKPHSHKSPGILWSTAWTLGRGRAEDSWGAKPEKVPTKPDSAFGLPALRISQREDFNEQLTSAMMLTGRVHPKKVHIICILQAATADSVVSFLTTLQNPV